MKMKPFNSNKKGGLNAPKQPKPTGPVGKSDDRTKKGPTAQDPTGNVGMFYEPDRSFTPNTTKSLPKKKTTPSKAKKIIGRSAASTRMVKKGRSNINKGLGG